MIPKLLELLFDSEADIRMYAAWVLGTAVQNNPHTQKDVRDLHERELYFIVGFYPMMFMMTS